MIQKKMCMLGAFAVGKTSLVSQFVQSMFSEKYHTTVGVKIDKKALSIGDQEVLLMLWDLHGEDDFQRVRMSYFRGTSGYLLVVDGTRQDTLETALSLQQRVQDEMGDLPFIVLLNKSDLQDEWEVDGNTISTLEQQGWTILKTSAKTGENVDMAFQQLAEAMVLP